VLPWLSGIARKAELEDWQMAQVVDALKVLFCNLLKVDWCRQWDWDHWRNTLPIFISLR
jgi:hypothetical protein